MSTDIKAIVAELERGCKAGGGMPVQELVTMTLDALPSLLAELHRLWAIEEAAERYDDRWGQWWANREVAEYDALKAALRKGT